MDHLHGYRNYTAGFMGQIFTCRHMGENAEKNISCIGDSSRTLTKNGRIATMCKAENMKSQIANETQGDVLNE